MTYTTNTEWLNRTANKSPGGPPWRFFVIHETDSPNPNDPTGTLDYNLVNDGKRGSYHDLIGRDGVRYAYLSPDQYVAWHAGVNTRVWVDGEQYDGGEVNSYSIGIEIDGPCDGSPATPEQLATTAALLDDYGEAYGIPRDAEHLIMHSQACAPIDPSYRSDAKCTTIAELISLCVGDEADQEAGRRYRVSANVAIVREGPSRAYDEAGRLGKGTEVVIDSTKYGECVGGGENCDAWHHLKNEWGFVHTSALERIQ